MTDKNIFDFFDYKAYLTHRLGAPGRRTGQRKALSVHLGCQTAYLSQVINGAQNLSLEQAWSANGFFEHSGEESEWFMLLVQMERAGSVDLKKYYDGKLKALQDKRLQFKNRLKDMKTISPGDKSKYYSHWVYLAVHMLASIPEKRTRKEMLGSLNINPQVLDEALSFLTGCGLLSLKGDEYHMGQVLIHLANDDENILRHHQNWRMQALNAIEKKDPESLHYSVCFSIAREDIPKIKDRIIKTVKDNLKDIEPSKEEVLMCNVIDLFEI